MTILAHDDSEGAGHGCEVRIRIRGEGEDEFEMVHSVENVNLIQIPIDQN
jgi:hypothetical protein